MTDFRGVMQNVVKACPDPMEYRDSGHLPRFRKWMILMKKAEYFPINSTV